MNSVPVASHGEVGGVLLPNASDGRSFVKEDFIPREYQIELFQAALKENIIVYLPTGSGKTFIAALLIREYSTQVTIPLNAGGKRTVFLVPTVVLAIQQAAYLRTHTHLTVKEYYGSMGVDLWQKERWKTEFEENHVLVMTAQIFVDILNHAFFSAQQLNLLVFDECHAAVKDAPMKQALEKLSKCPAPFRPKILGLTAALFRRRCKPNQVNDVIQELAETMGCVVKISDDICSVSQKSTKPCEVIFQYRDDGNGLCGAAERLAESINRSVVQLLSEFYDRYGENSSRINEKTEILTDTLKEIAFLLNSFGAFGAYHATLLYITMLEDRKHRAVHYQFVKDLDALLTLCRKIRDKCNACFSQFPSKDSMLLFTQPRVLKLLEILRQLNPAFTPEGLEPVKMCAIVFVERRCMANVLYHYLKEIRKHDESLAFIKPLFTMGQAVRSGQMKESAVLNMKQNEVMNDFRNGSCNLLVSTSVLEEGVDVPACNLVIRFDRIKTYCDYVQTKGRARAPKAIYAVMLSEADTDAGLNDLMQFHSIEQKLIASNSFEDDRERDIDEVFATLIEPYTPFGEEGPRITMQSSISLVNRYCAQLPTEAGVVLAPKWTITEVREEHIDPEWLERLNSLLNQLPPDDERLFFECRIVLPLSSPLKEEVVGCIMPSRRLAKRSAALKTCIKLHQLKEFDDAHLLPCHNWMMQAGGADEEEGNEYQGRPDLINGLVYDRAVPQCLINCRPQPGQHSHVYAIKFNLTKPCLDETKFYLPCQVNVKLGIITSQIIPPICPFPLLTRSGTYEVTLVGMDTVRLDSDQLELLTKFHRYLFCDVIYLGKEQPMELDPHYPRHQYIITLLERDSSKIDYRFIEDILNSPPIDWEQKPSLDVQFVFSLNRYRDAVIFPSYRPFGHLNAYYVDAISDLTPLSPFPEEEYETYADYYESKYKLAVTNNEQRLLEVSRDFTGKNYLIERSLLVRGLDTSFHLVPELCYLHPIPASVWKQIVWIPSVLHRLNGLLVAEELRVTINREAGIGVEFLPGCFNVSSVWSPLVLRKTDNGLSPPVTDPRLLPLSFRPRINLKKADLLDAAEGDMLWNLELSMDSSDNNGDEAALSEISNTSTDDLIAISSRDPMNEPTTWNEEMLNLRFDVSSMSPMFGPSPGQILEALTLTQSNDGFDLERLETLGDSILKLVISIYVFDQTGSENLDEGQLTILRSRQINNKHLFQLGIEKNLGSLVAAQGFDAARSFLPPGYRPVVALESNEPDLRLKQVISSKNVADCLEALIGVYLLTNGIKGAITVMNWFGLKTVSEDGQSGTWFKGANESNGFPILRVPSSRKDDGKMLQHLFAGLDSFERRLRYTFKDKKLLIEALTHASYDSNRLTNCYQRLEFLGDAVLDYLITRYYYESVDQYRPGVLTDLRSAMVNNETFAVMAVRNRFHVYFKHHLVVLSAAVDRFVQFSEENGFRLLHDFFILEEIGGEQVASNVYAPKVLGDIFESVAGAIFIDSGMSLDAVWKSYLPFLHDALGKFERNIPLSALRVLHERFPGGVKFKKANGRSDGRVYVTMEVKDFGTFRGVGRCSKAGKSAAAKYALSQLNKTGKP